MVVMSDWGGGGGGRQPGLIDEWINSMKPKPPQAIARPTERTIAPAPTSNYIRPYTPPPPVNRAYPSVPAAQQNAYVGPVAGPIGGGYGGGGYGGGGGGMAGIQNTAPAAPISPPKPPPPPRKTVEDFAKLYDDNSELAAVDSTFAEQKSLYAQLLKKYLADHDINIGNINDDARLGKEGIAQNMTRGLTSLNEDFAARGLGRSGLQAKEHDDTSQAFKKQETNVELQRVRGENDLNSRKNKYIGENGENGSNMSAARREAYARLVAKQDIV